MSTRIPANEPAPPPNLGTVVDTLIEHGRLLVEFFGEKIGIQQLRKFTAVDPASGERRLIKSAKTKLEPVSPEFEAAVRDAFSAEKYGAPLMRVGWHAKVWSDEYFKVVDVAARVGSGVGAAGPPAGMPSPRSHIGPSSFPQLVGQPQSSSDDSSSDEVVEKKPLGTRLKNVAGRLAFWRK